MIRWLLLLLCANAFAQDCAPRTHLNPTARATAEVLQTDPAGDYSYWWCQQPNNTWLHDWNVTLKGYGTPEAIRGVASVILSASSPTAGVQAARKRFSQAPKTPQEVYDFLRLRRLACKGAVANPPPGLAGPPVDTCGAVPTPPVVTTHTVKTNGTALTRPAYTLTNGVRGSVSIGRADVGQPCDLTKPTIASGADVWASFGPTPEAGKVALCVKTTN